MQYCIVPESSCVLCATAANRVETVASVMLKTAQITNPSRMVVHSAFKDITTGKQFWHTCCVCLDAVTLCFCLTKHLYTELVLDSISSPVKSEGCLGIPLLRWQCRHHATLFPAELYHMRKECTRRVWCRFSLFPARFGACMNKQDGNVTSMEKQQQLCTADGVLLSTRPVVRAGLVSLLAGEVALCE